MPWAVAVAAVGAAYSAQQQKSAAKKSANAVQSASNRQIEEERRQLAITTANQQPFIDAGKAALERQSQILNGHYDAFYQSPDYLATLQQGQQFMDRSAAARGSLYSSGHSADMQKYGQGLAAQQLNSYWSKLAGQAGQGYNAGNALGQFGANSASNIGNAYGNAANARASSYQQIANANSQAAAAIGGAATNAIGYYSNRGQQSQAGQSGYKMNMGNMQGANWNSLGYQNPNYFTYKG